MNIFDIFEYWVGVTCSLMCRIFHFCLCSDLLFSLCMASVRQKYILGPARMVARRRRFCLFLWYISGM